MPYNTIRCSITVAQIETYVLRAFLPVGESTTLRCYLPLNSYAKLSVASLSLLDRPHSHIKCITYCFEAGNVKAYCSKPVNTYGSKVSALVISNTQSQFGVVKANIGQIAVTDIKAVVPVYLFDQINALMSSQATVKQDVKCVLNIACNTKFIPIDINVGFGLNISLDCITRGELYDTVQCCVTSPTKVTTIRGIISSAADLDSYSDIKCTIPRFVGTPINYVALEVLLGDRFTSSLNCILTIPPNIYNDLKCSTSYVLGGDPSWSKYQSTEGLFIRIMNIGINRITKALLQDANVTIETEDIVRLGSIWQVRFDYHSSVTNYVIVLTIEPGNKILVIDKPNGEFNI